MDAAHEAAADAAPGYLIRAAEPADATGISAVIGRLGTVEGTLQLPDMPVASRLEFLQRNEPGACRLVAVAGSEVIGSAGLHPVGTSLRRGHVRGLGIGIAQEWQGRGVGTAMMKRLLEWADGWAGVLRVELTVHADNEHAIALYRRMGFVEEGRHTGYSLRAGQYIDALCMARLHPAPPQIQMR